MDGDRGPEAAGQPASPDDRAEWVRFYVGHYHRLVRFMMHNGALPEEAKDAAQEAFTESWELLSRDPDRWQAVSNKAAWVRTVALRRHLRPPGHRRRLPAVPTGLPPDQAAPGPGHAELTAQAQVVLEALEALDSEARAVMAFYLDGFSTAETAIGLDITGQRVRDVKKRARAALKRQLAAPPQPRGGNRDK
jgi:RNA polymerase sigma factor (sigma-70 family)